MTDKNAPPGRYAKKAPTRGGVRVGAGRKTRTATKSIREIADRLLLSGKITPLEVILEAMHKARAKKDWAGAAGFAKDAAPFIHPRLQAVELTGNEGANAFRPAPVVKVVIAR